VFFRPTVEAENGQQEAFLPADPIDLIRQGKFHKVPFLAGVNSNEGLLSLRGRALVVTHVLIPRIEQRGSSEMTVIRT
jgi:carboxylesterase type B